MSTWKLLCIAFLICSALFWCCYLMYLRYQIKVKPSVKCKDVIIRQYIQKLCGEYKSNKIGGNLCQPLCESHTISVRKCLKTDIGKTVFSADCQKPVCTEQDVIVAMKHDDRPYEGIHMQHYKPLEKYLHFGFPRDWFEEQGDFTVRGRYQLLDLLNKESNIVLSENELILLLADDTKPFSSVSEKLRFHRDTISLVAQVEFVLTKLLSSAQFMPNFYGTCGPLYAVEFTDSFVYPLTWPDRAKLGLKLLIMVESLDSFHYEPLHLCDFKEHNIGISKEQDGTVKVVDADMLWYESVLVKELAQTSCINNFDCRIDDCQCVCNKETNMCRPYRTNSNLQVLCENILLKYESKGLLCQPPPDIREEMMSLLSRCSNLSVNSINFHETQKKIKTQLYSLLQASI